MECARGVSPSSASWSRETSRRSGMAVLTDWASVVVTGVILSLSVRSFPAHLFEQRADAPPAAPELLRDSARGHLRVGLELCPDQLFQVSVGDVPGVGPGLAPGPALAAARNRAGRRLESC